MKLRKSRNSVFQMGYHLVWCAKYRHCVFDSLGSKELEKLFFQIANDNSFTIEELQILPDHVHLFITCTPNHSIPNIVKALKGVSARFLFQKFPEIRNKLWGGHLWNPSYYVGTVGNISEDTIKQYIATQKEA